MSKAASNEETLEITGSHRVSKGKRRIKVFETSEGDMIREGLANRLNLTVAGLNGRIRSYGELDPRVIHGPGYFKKKKPNWQGLSDKPRSAAKLEGMTMSDFLNSAPQGRKR